MTRLDRLYRRSALQFDSYHHFESGFMGRRMKIGGYPMTLVVDSLGSCTWAQLLTYTDLIKVKGAEVRVVNVGEGGSVWRAMGTYWYPPYPIAVIGTPEGQIAAPVGSLACRGNGGAGSTLYVKEGGGTGNTGWVALATGIGGGSGFDPGTYGRVPIANNDTVTIPLLQLSTTLTSTTPVSPLNIVLPAGAAEKDRYRVASVRAVATPTWSAADGAAVAVPNMAITGGGAVELRRFVISGTPSWLPA